MKNSRVLALSKRVSGSGTGVDVRILILTYHSLHTNGSPVSVPPAALRQHLRRLRDAGCIVLPLSEAIERAAELEPAGARLVALTFDDGYATVLEHAVPLLAGYGWRGTVFPVTDYVGRHNRWPSQPANISAAGLLGWSELRELASAGWEVGAHSRTHPDLTSLDNRGLADEVRGARAILEDHLGLAVKAFAYPYGRHDQRVRACVEQAYAAACTTAMRVADDFGDRYTLGRIDAWYFSQPRFAEFLASPWMEPYVAFCRVARTSRAILREVTQSVRP